MKLYLGRPNEREGEREREGAKTLLNFLKSCKHFLHTYIDFFPGPFFLRACHTERGKWAVGGGGWGGSLLRIHIQDLFRHICYDRLKLGAIKIIYYFA